jgi:hypothetical protein
MLTAQKENNQINPKSLVHRPPTLRSFEKVVHSIDGLRERVQGLAVEQLSETERQLQTVSLQLGALQQTVSTLSEIKALMSRMEEMLPQAQAATVDPSILASVDSCTPLHSLPHLMNLAKFRRIMKLVNAAKSVAVLSDSPDRNHQALILDLDANAEPSGLNQLVAKLAAIEHPFRETVEDSAIEGTAGEGTEQWEHSESLPTSERDFVWTEPNGDEPVDIISAKETTSACNLSAAIDQSAEATDHRASSDAVMVNSTASGQPQTVLYKESDFDRRLLDDLIKDYGEFTVVPNLPATTTPKKEAKSETPALKRTTDSTTAANSASHRKLPTRKDGELDRKLKKLIKDYGENDLYSQQSPLNLKTGVFVAFVLLILAFSAFYFFSSPKSVVPATNSSTAAQPQDKGKRAANSETLSTGAVSTFEIPKPAEAGSSRNVSNNIVTKQTR